MQLIFTGSKRIASVTLHCALLFIFTNSVTAQGVLEEIVVTAQKREQSLQDVPIAVTAVTGTTIRKRAIAQGRELLDSIPGLTTAGTGFGKVEYSLRGIGVDDFQSSAGSATAIYQDGVVFGSNFGTSGLVFDLDRVEVLKGPQGTLWGRNTTGGLVNYVTVKPEVGGETNGYASVTAAEYDQYAFEGAVGLSLSDTMAARISGTFRTLDGYFENVNPAATGDDDTGGYDWGAIRGQLVWQPDERLTTRLSITYSELDGEDTPHKAFGLGAHPFDFGRSCTGPLRGRPGTTCVNLLGNVADSDVYTTEQGEDGFSKMELFQTALFIDYEFDAVTATVIAAFQSNERQDLNETDGAPSGVLRANFDDEHEQWSVEARLSSNSDGPWSWVIGGFYYDDELTYFRSNYILAFGGTSAGRLNIIESENKAVFGEVSYDFTDRFTATAGVRLTWDERVGAIRAGSLVPPNPTLTNTFIGKDLWFGMPHVILADEDNQKEDWFEPSARISLQYALTEEVNLWFTWSRSFRGGDFNGGALANDEFEVTEPEFLNNYEAGFKGDFLDGTLRLNASGYYYDYTDKIGFVEIPGARGELGSISLLANFGDVEGYGAEVELDWQPVEQFNIYTNFAWTESEFVTTSFDLGFGGGDVTGNRTAKTPALTMNAFFTYTVPVAQGGRVDLTFNPHWRDNQYFTDTNTDYESQDAFWILNASIGYTSADDKWDARLWVKNLTDEEWLADGFTFISEHLSIPGGPPRQFGGTVSYRF